MIAFADIERIYEALAVAIDRVGAERETVMLARLVLLLARDDSDAERVLRRIADAVASVAHDRAKAPDDGPCPSTPQRNSPL